MRNTPKKEITRKMIVEAETIEIISGEGENGTIEEYEGKRTVKAVWERLEEERCSGDRWAEIIIDGKRF